MKNRRADPSGTIKPMTALDPRGTTAAVIVTHRRVDLLKHSLEQVVSQTHPVDWVIVVDNLSLIHISEPTRPY